MAEIITSLVSESLDECAPVKTFKIRNQNKHGISEKTRKLIKERDESRKAIHKSNVSNKVVLLLGLAFLFTILVGKESPSWYLGILVDRIDLCEIALQNNFLDSLAEFFT